MERPLRTLSERFTALFNGPPTLAAGAPGRVNLIGEHTDYNDGFVCPMAIDRETIILAAPRKDQVIRMHSLLANQTVEFSIDQPVTHDGPTWSLYPRGAAEAMRQRLPQLRGMDALVDSTVPAGGGLSSSASFEVATATALLAINNSHLPPQEIALACQWAEHNYPRMPCGIMDQFISTMGKKGHAMLLDCRDRSTRFVPFDDDGVRIVISNSNVKHELVSGEYQARRRQCEEAVAICRKTFPQIASLRDVTMEMLQAAPGMEKIIHRRARHVVTEIQRTVEFADALTRRDYPRCGTLMFASHASLRDDYEVSTSELDALVEIARALPGVYGARMTGGGFGGCIVALCDATAAGPLAAAIARDYPKHSKGTSATTFTAVASEGASFEMLG